MLAEILTEVVVVTVLVVTVKEALVAPAATDTLAGTCAAAALLVERVTSAPPAGADPFNLTVPVDEVPPITEVGPRVKELSLAAVTMKVAVRVVP